MSPRCAGIVGEFPFTVATPPPVILEEGRVPRPRVRVPAQLSRAAPAVPATAKTTATAAPSPNSFLMVPPDSALLDGLPAREREWNSIVDQRACNPSADPFGTLTLALVSLKYLPMLAFGLSEATLRAVYHASARKFFSFVRKIRSQCPEAPRRPAQAEKKALRAATAPS